MQCKITSTDDELRKAPSNGQRLGRLKLGEVVTCGSGWVSGWRQVTQSSRGAGWYPAAYIAEVEDGGGDVEPDPVEIDPATSLIVTTIYESGRTGTTYYQRVT